MKWSKLSIGRQIGIVAAVLSVLLAVIIVANVILVVAQSRSNWRDSAQLIHEEAVSVVSD